MGMRSADARWLTRDVLPFVEQLRNARRFGHSPALARIEVQAAELAEQLRSRTTAIETVPDVLRRLGVGHRNPSVEVYEAEVDGHRVPYLEVTRWPCEWRDGYPRQLYPDVTLVCDTPGDYRHVTDGDRCDWCWTVTVDGRFSYDFENEGDVVALLPLVANAMAVAAGFTSHGPRSFPRNAHGPAVGLAGIVDLEPAELQIADGLSAESIAEKVAWRLRSSGLFVVDQHNTWTVSSSSVEADSVECEHPSDGVFWNDFNRVVQCHRCGRMVEAGEVVWPKPHYRLYVAPAGAPSVVPHYVQLAPWPAYDSGVCWAVFAQGDSLARVTGPTAPGGLEAAVQAAVALDDTAYPVSVVEG